MHDNREPGDPRWADLSLDQCVNGETRAEVRVGPQRPEGYDLESLYELARGNTNALHNRRRRPTEGLRRTTARPNRRYEQAMARAAAMYQDAVDAVDEALGSSSAFITQLGGMCLAIEAPIEGGWLWVTDLQDNLSWAPDDRNGWTVGLYLGDPDDSPDPTVTVHRSDAILSALREAITDGLTRLTAIGTRSLSD